MPKTLGEWLFLIIIGSVSFLWTSNMAIAVLFFSGSFVMGYYEGFDVALIILSSVSGFLVAGEFAGLLFYKSERIFKVQQTPHNNIFGEMAEWLKAAVY